MNRWTFLRKKKQESSEVHTIQRDKSLKTQKSEKERAIQRK